MSDIIDDYLRDVRKRLPHVGVRERDAVLAEIEDHLRSEARRLRKEHRRLSADEAALRATNAFGRPEEIGIAYGARGGVINRSTGEILLEVAVLTTRAAGRGVRGVLKWTGITALTLLGIGLVLVIAALIFAGHLIDTFQEDIRENVPRPLYSYSGSWAFPDAHTDATSSRFEVPQTAREFWFSVDINPGGTGPSGCARVMLIAPSGETAFDSGTGCGTVSETMTFTQSGSWQVSYQFIAYQGSVGMEAYYFAAPRQA